MGNAKGLGRSTVFCTLLSLCFALLGCSGAQSSDEGAVEAHQADVEPAGPADDGPDVELMADGVPAQVLRDVLGRSAGDFLRLVEVEAETRSGSFLGWRLVSLPESQPSWLDVAVGDVVTAINGMSVERPEDAQQIWEMLQVASEVRIDLLRGEEERSVRIPILAGEEDEEGPAADERRGPEE